jgi:LETM1 and EF-hand domain-containing protein 1
MKFIPFSFFLIIPGLEFLLPAWLIIFPNSVPSQFQSEERQIKLLKEAEEQRDVSAEKLVYIIPLYLKTLEKNTAIPDDDMKQIKELRNLMNSDVEYILNT